MSSAYFTVVTVRARYLLLFSFVSLKPFSFILSTDVLSSLSRQMIKWYGAIVSHCSTPATTSKWSVSPCGERTFTFVFLYSIIMAATVSLGRLYAPKPKSCYIVWNEQLQAEASMSMHIKRNICALIKEATSPHCYIHIYTGYIPTQ